MSARMHVSGWGLIAIGVVSWCGCGGEGGSSSPVPVPMAPQDAGADAVDDRDGSDSATPPPDAATPMRRIVTSRDPFGNYAATDNLLVDGDFEWSGVFASQYPWFRDPAVGSMTTPTMAVGARCRSGIKCAMVSPKSGIAGFAARPPGNADHADLSVWVRPSSTGSSCGIVAISVSGCSIDSSSSVVDTTSVQPEPDGWCHFVASVQMPADTPCVFVSVNGMVANSVLVDDVVMTAPKAASKATRSLLAASPEHEQIVARLRATIRERLRPTPARDAALPPALRGKVR